MEPGPGTLPEPRRVRHAACYAHAQLTPGTQPWRQRSPAIGSHDSQVQELAGLRLLQWAEGRVQPRQRADPGAWAQRRARFKPFWGRPGSGGATGSHAALAEATSWVLCCQKCGSITDFRAASRQARAAGRQQVAAGDGCGSKTCSADHRPARFARRQRERAHALLHGAKVLINVPESLRGSSVYIYDRAVTDVVARVVASEF
jgi:hypothetical protein